MQEHHFHCLTHIPSVWSWSDIRGLINLSFFFIFFFSITRIPLSGSPISSWISQNSNACNKITSEMLAHDCHSITATPFFITSRCQLMQKSFFLTSSSTFYWFTLSYSFHTYHNFSLRVPTSLCDFSRISTYFTRSPLWPGRSRLSTKAIKSYFLNYLSHFRWKHIFLSLFAKRRLSIMLPDWKRYRYHL